MIEQTRFLSTVSKGSKFKLENIYSGVNFCGKHVCGEFARPYFDRLLENRKTCKTFMPHGITFKLGNYSALSSCVNKFCKLILIKT